MVSRVERGEMRIFRVNRRKRTAHGAATVEVLVAVAVVIMVGALGIISFGNTDRARVGADAAEVALFLQQARMRALESGQKVEIAVSEDSRRIDAGGKRLELPETQKLTATPVETVLHPSGESDGMMVRLERGDASAEVTLDWLTGRVSLQ